MSVRIGVSIINFRTGALTIACAQSALVAAEGLSVDIVIVDNFSGDGSAELIGDWIATLPPEAPVRLVLSDENAGFSAGHNIGIEALPNADWIFLLNSDGVVAKDFFERLGHTIAQADPKTGLLAPQIEDQQGNVQVSNFKRPSPISELERGACTGVVTKLVRRWVVALPPPANLDDVQWVSFAGVVLRQEMIADIGPMDEDYFLYFEDTEYCLRATQRGWKIGQASQARMVHFRGGSGPVKALTAQKKRLPAYFYQSRTRYFRQSFGVLGPFMANILFLLGRGIANARRLLGKPAPPGIESEASDIWINFRTPLQSRQ